MKLGPFHFLAYLTKIVVNGQDEQGVTMGRFAFLNKDILFERKDDQKLWLKYCGFLDLYIEEY